MPHFALRILRDCVGGGRLCDLPHSTLGYWSCDCNTVTVSYPALCPYPSEHTQSVAYQ
jgi:hypothetical protein